MKIICLVENTSFNDNFEAEHGLSLYLETNNHKILFDMGQTDLFARNAEKLSVDLSDVDIAVLSHGHYDHGGGLSRFLELNSKASVYLSRYAFEPHYNGNEKYIGLDTSLAEEKRLIFTGDEFVIEEGLTLYSCNNNERKYNCGSCGLNMMQDGKIVPDDFRHEQYLLIEEGNKKVLISGCSHKGILDITEWFNPDVLVGGFHFSKLPPDETLVRYSKQLNKSNTDFYTCHCTGVKQFEFMKPHINRLFYLSAGQIINI